MSDSPAVTVLLATYNGRKYLPQQLDTILDQRDVEVRVVVSDDGSFDGTAEYLADRAAADRRITVLPAHRSGGAAPNFYRLLQDAPTGDTPVAFADQDDIWHPGKLASQVAVLKAGADGVSSDVMAFDAAGHRHLIRKSYPERSFDYLAQSPGPGCTQLLSAELAGLVRAQLAAGSPATTMEFHDWLVYGICRAAGLRWVIQNVPTVDYRQHESNAMGANRGWRAIVDRIRLVRSTWHRGESVLMAQVAERVAAGHRPDLAAVLADWRELLTATGFRARIRLARRSGELRRRPRDRAVLATMILVGWW